MKFNVPHADRNKSGVYVIRNSINQRVYVGGTKALLRRCSQHIRLLRRNEHPNSGLQQLANLYTSAVLEFCLLEICTTDLLRSREAYFIGLYQSAKPDTGFNLVVKGWKRPPEVRQKLIGRPVSAETRAKIGSHQKGRKASPEAITSLSIAQKARWANAPEEAKKAFRKRVAEANSPAVQQRRIAALKGVPKSPETKANMAAAAKTRANSQDARIKLQEKFGTPEAKLAFLEKMERGRKERRDTK